MLMVMKKRTNDEEKNSLNTAVDLTPLKLRRYTNIDRHHRNQIKLHHKNGPDRQERKTTKTPLRYPASTINCRGWDAVTPVWEDEVCFKTRRELRGSDSRSGLWPQGSSPCKNGTIGITQLLMIARRPYQCDWVARSPVTQEIHRSDALKITRLIRTSYGSMCLSRQGPQ